MKNYVRSHGPAFPSGQEAGSDIKHTGLRIGFGAKESATIMDFAILFIGHIVNLVNILP